MQWTWNSQDKMKKKSKAGGKPLPDVKCHYQATVIKAAWYQNRHIHHWN